MFTGSIAVLGLSDIECGGGGERNAIDLAEITSRNGLNAFLIGSGCPMFKGATIIENKNIHYYPSSFRFDLFARRTILRMTNGSSMGLIGLFDFSKIEKTIDVYENYYFQYPSIMLSKVISRCRHKTRKKVVIGNHGTFFEMLSSHKSFVSKGIERILRFIIFHRIPRDTIIHAQNIFQEQYYRKLGFHNVYLIPQNGVSFDQYYITKRDGFNVAFLNKLTNNKGLPLLKEIIKLSPEVIEFHIMGSGILDEDLMRKKNVHVYGFVDEVKKREILSGCDVMINCSEYESLSISSIEGLASGLPIIATDTSGLRTIEHFMQEGVYIMKRDPASFVNKIMELYRLKDDDPDAFINYRANLKERASMNFDKPIIDRKIWMMIKNAYLVEEIPAINSTKEHDTEISMENTIHNSAV